MATITREITVDVARENLFAAILAKQDDQNSRFLKITITNLGEKIAVPATATAIINARRADGAADAFYATVNDDGTVTAPLTNWMLGLDDVVNCSISIISDEDVKLTTMTFQLEVQHAEYTGEDIEQDENYDILVTLINQTTEVKEAAETATENAIAATAEAEEAADNANTEAARAKDAADYFGSPLTAATAADMTATDHVYVYTGSETGYTYGNWYYYNGSAWVSGGIYNSAAVDTDTTLSIAGKAADAKATGDAIHDTQAMIAGREASTTATKNYSVGDLLVCSDTLYRVTAAIATGETITEGTNVVSTTTAAELAANVQKALAEFNIITQITDYVYQGVDLTTKFADEIIGDPWAWIRGRIRSGNFSGIHINDWIPVTTTEATPRTYKACVGGINTYKGGGDTAVGNHIDFICRELWPTRKPVNPVNYNNGLIPVETITGDGTTTTFVLSKEMNGIASVTQGGTGLTGYTYDASTFTLTFAEAPAAGSIIVTGTGTEHPWLASDLYHWLNSLAGQVPNGTGLNPAVKHVDYTQGGVYHYLPAALKAVIVEKRAYLPKRYSASGLLSDDNAGGWADIGKLWLPSEWEVYGGPARGGLRDYSVMGNCIQYPIFQSMANRVKNRSGSRDSWWVLSVCSGSTTNWCYVNGYGVASTVSASSASVAAPVCFRIS